MSPNPAPADREEATQQQQRGSRIVAGDQVMPFDVIVSRSVRESAKFLQTAQQTIDSQKEDLSKQKAELERRKADLARRERRYKMKKRKMRRLLRDMQSLGASIDSSDSEMSAGSESEVSDEVQRLRKRSSAARSRTPVNNNRPKKRKTIAEGGDFRKTESSIPPVASVEGSPAAIDTHRLQEEKEARAAGAFSSGVGRVQWKKRHRAWIASWKDETTGSLRTKSFNPRKKYDGNVQAARDDAIVFLTQRTRSKSPPSNDPTKKEISSLGEDEEEEDEMMDEDEQLSPHQSKVSLEEDPDGLRSQKTDYDGKGVTDATMDGVDKVNERTVVVESTTWPPPSSKPPVDDRVEVVECSLVSSSSSSSSDVSPPR